MKRKPQGKTLAEKLAQINGSDFKIPENQFASFFPDQSESYKEVNFDNQKHVEKPVIQETEVLVSSEVYNESKLENNEGNTKMGD